MEAYPPAIITRIEAAFDAALIGCPQPAPDESLPGIERAIREHLSDVRVVPDPSRRYHGIPWTEGFQGWGWPIDVRIERGGAGAYRVAPHADVDYDQPAKPPEGGVWG